MTMFVFYSEITFLNPWAILFENSTSSWEFLGVLGMLGLAVDHYVD